MRVAAGSVALRSISRCESIGHLDLRPFGLVVAGKRRERADRAMLFRFDVGVFGGVIGSRPVPCGPAQVIAIFCCQYRKRLKLKAMLARPIFALARSMPMVRMNRHIRCFWVAKTCSTAERILERAALAR